MKAYVLESINNLVYKEVPLKELEDNWVRIKVKASGICSSDISRIFTKGTYHFPTIPGHEFSGVVTEVKNNKLKKVGVFPLIPCKTCEQCKKNSYETCEHYDYLGSRRDGGFAEYVDVPFWNIIVLPNSIDFSLGAMLEPMAVAIHALNRVIDLKNKKIAVIGTGMIGICIAKFALLKGASSSVVIGRTNEKRTIIEEIGEVNYKTSISRNEYDIVFEAVGNNDTICSAIDGVSPGGKVVFVGNPSGDIVLNQNLFWQVLRKQLTIIGTWNSHYEQNDKSDWSEVLDLLSREKINIDKLITHRFQKENLVDGLDLMKNHKEPYCKVMTIW